MNDFLENSISEDCEACLRFQEDFFANKEVKNNPCKNHHPVTENYDKIRRKFSCIQKEQLNNLILKIHFALKFLREV